MDHHPTSTTQKKAASLLSQVTLHFEYDKKITEVRANLHAKRSQNTK
ncbi:MAG: hypothetical protein Q4B05_03220 [Candidatus Saccharibacteria bacterium]|nr:hypothetical protein [Candidatus Saccharibacteria bacterium]